MSPYTPETLLRDCEARCVLLVRQLEETQAALRLLTEWFDTDFPVGDFDFEHETLYRLMAEAKALLPTSISPEHLYGEPFREGVPWKE